MIYRQCVIWSHITYTWLLRSEQCPIKLDVKETQCSPQEPSVVTTFSDSLVACDVRQLEVSAQIDMMLKEALVFELRDLIVWNAVFLRSRFFSAGLVSGVESFVSFNLVAGTVDGGRPFGALSVYKTTHKTRA